MWWRLFYRHDCYGPRKIAIDVATESTAVMEQHLVFQEAQRKGRALLDVEIDRLELDEEVDEYRFQGIVRLERCIDCGRLAEASLKHVCPGTTHHTA